MYIISAMRNLNLLPTIKPLIGQSFAFYGKIYLCIEGNNCFQCALFMSGNCDQIACMDYEREDETEVIFVS